MLGTRTERCSARVPREVGTCSCFTEWLAVALKFRLSRAPVSLAVGTLQVTPAPGAAPPRVLRTLWGEAMLRAHRGPGEPEPGLPALQGAQVLVSLLIKLHPRPAPQVPEGTAGRALAPLICCQDLGLPVTLSIFGLII